MKIFKKIMLLFTFSFLLVLVLVFVCDFWVSSSAKNKTFNTTDEIPYSKVGLLLGTAKFVTGGYINLYYKYRIEATVTLFKAGKIRYLIISGDNNRKEYNEPEMMRTDLMTLGIDSSKIFLDYAGFRTFDSMVRLKKVFGQEEVTVISQLFHNERAIFIAEKEDIKAIGFNARDVGQAYGFRVQLREKLARVKVLLDYIFGKQAKFLGEKVLIPK